MTTALILYGSNVASSTLSSACVTPITTGGSEASVTTTSPASGNGYLEIFSQGGTGVLKASLGAPSGKGWLFDATTLEGQSIPAGAWSATVALADTARSNAVGSVTLRAYKRSSTGVYSQICTLTLASPTLNTTRTAYTLSTASAASAWFATGDKLYLDLYVQDTGWASDTIAVYESSSGTTGVANDMQVTTPGYNPTLALVVTNVGLNVFVGATSTPIITYVAVGTSSTTPTVTDTQLGAEVFRKGISSITPGIAPGEVLFNMYLGPSDAVGVNIQEVGFFGGSATGTANSGTLIARGLYVHSKTGLESIQEQFDLAAKSL